MVENRKVAIVGKRTKKCLSEVTRNKGIYLNYNSFVNRNNLRNFRKDLFFYSIYSKIINLDYLRVSQQFLNNLRELFHPVSL